MAKKKTFPKKKTTINTGVLDVVEPTEIAVAEKPKTSPKLPSFRKISERPRYYRLLVGRKKVKGTNKYTYPVVHMLKAEDVIYDPIKGVNRKIRYIPGEPSIYEDEQKKESKLRAPITFNEGFLVVNKQNPTLIAFLDNCNANQNNPNRVNSARAVFELVDNARDVKQKINKELKEIDAMSLALKLPISKLIGYAKVLGVNVDKSTEEIRYDMKVLAKKSPTSFIAGLDDPKTDAKETILNAKEYSIIKIEPNRVSWKRGSETIPICHVPVGVKPLDFFADFCLSEDGDGVLIEMEKQLARFNN